MKPSTAGYLLELNRRFYCERGQDFSETRLRVQPGVRRLLDTLHGDESILDLGCGNGAFAHELSRRDHRGPYVGVDFSTPLLEKARCGNYVFPVVFIQADLVPLACGHSTIRDQIQDLVPAGLLPPDNEPWSLVTAFAVLHHIPARENRLALFAQVRTSLRTDGLFAHSSWQFSASKRLQSRIRPWSGVELDTADVDQGDYLLDWRRGGIGFRYVHEFREDELADLATESGFAVAGMYYSDGADRKSGLYQVWRPAI